MSDNLKALAEAALLWQAKLVTTPNWCEAGDCFEAQKYLAAANPQAILTIIAKLEAQQEEIARGRRKISQLRKYANHRPGCSIFMPTDGPCDCGLQEAQS